MIPSPIIRSMNSGYFDYCPTCSVKLNGIGEYRICQDCAEAPLKLNTPGTGTPVGHVARTSTPVGIGSRTRNSTPVGHVTRTSTPIGIGSRTGTSTPVGHAARSSAPVVNLAKMGTSTSIVLQEPPKNQRPTRHSRPTHVAHSKHSATVRNRSSKRQLRPSAHRLTSRNLAQLDSANRRKKNRELPVMEGTVQLQVIHTRAEVYKKPVSTQPALDDETVHVHPAPARRPKHKKKHHDMSSEQPRRGRRQDMDKSAHADNDDVLHVRIKNLRIGGKSLGKLFKGNGR